MGGHQSSEQDLEHASLTWTVPPWRGSDFGSRALITPTARRHFAAGEVVERAYCLELHAEDLAGSFLDAFCPVVQASDGQRCRLFPFGWGLLYAPCTSGANLLAEHCFEAAPPPPPSSEEDRSPTSDDVPSPRHWLVFRAARAVLAGEPLRVAQLGPGQLVEQGRDIMAAAAATLDEQGFSIVSGADVDELDEESPAEIGMHEDGDSPVVVGASQMHGVGVFAARDIEKGELLEAAPTLPVRSSDVGDTALGHYTFQSDFSDDGLDLLHLGFGCIYNHSPTPNVTHYKFEDQHPYVEAYIANEFIPAGREICHDYGPDYFSGRGMEMKPTPYEGERKWRLVRRGCC